MKKHKTLFIILFIVLGLLVTAAAIFGVTKLTHKADANAVFTLDEEYMDTAYNNVQLSYGNLAYADGKLYYNYFPNSLIKGVFNYGTYAINDEGSYRAAWGGPTLYGEHELQILQVFQGKLYDFTTGKSPDAVSYDTHEAPLRDVSVSDNAIYRVAGDTVYISKDGVNEEPLFTNARDIDYGWGSSVYITEKSIVYLAQNGHLKEYDFAEEEYTVDIELAPYDMQVTDPYNGITYTMVKPLKCGDETLLFACQSGEADYLYQVKGDKLELIYTRTATNAELSGESDFTVYNACGDNVFISSLGKGIDKINVTTGEVTNIVPKGSEDIYVFGNKWIYYTQKDSHLYRTTQDGQITEKVF